MSCSAKPDEIGESPRCCPVLGGLRDRCIAAMLATRSGSQWSCSTTCVAGTSGFQPAAARSSALTSKKVAAPDGFAPSTSRVRAGRSRCLSYRAIRSANRSCTGLSPIPAACVATNALAELKWSGTSVLPPSVSPIRTARIAVFLVPGHVVSF
jgi:hypothetical protein